MKFVLEALLFASLIGSGTASFMIGGVELGSLEIDGDGADQTLGPNPVCQAWLDDNGDPLFGMGYKMNGGCHNYHGPISGMPQLKDSGNDFACDAADQLLAKAERVTVQCFNKRGQAYTGTGVCPGSFGGGCPYAIIAVAVDADDVDVGGINFKGGPQGTLWLWGGTAALMATYDYSAVNIVVRPSLHAYRTNGLCNGLCPNCQSSCPAISHLDFCFECGGGDVFGDRK